MNTQNLRSPWNELYEFDGSLMVLECLDVEPLSSHMEIPHQIGFGVR